MPLINDSNFATEAMLVIPKQEYDLPLMYTFGLKTNKIDLSFFNDKTVSSSKPTFRLRLVK